MIVTGGCGFIGSSFVRLVLAERQDWAVTVLDKLTYAGNLENISPLLNDNRLQFVKGDVCDAGLVGRLMDGAAAVVHFAAESHVDRSIHDPRPFLETNVIGTATLLAAARNVPGLRHLQVSTDEVYGSLGETGHFTEQSPLQANNPYSASKASADLLVRAYHRTFGLDTIITRCDNNYGPRQFPEKVIPLFIANAMENKPLPLYGDGLNVRDWIYVEDHCRAILLALEKGRAGEVYNIGAGHEITNLELARSILAALGKPESLIQFVKDRPGHDRRYAIDPSKTKKELGWQAAVAFKEGIARTVRWYQENTEWLRRVRSGAYMAYYRQHYVQAHGMKAQP
ncbi:MAG TPA: dTDP-glucose 4,6-dehydratase [Candidatus Brocadiia bacterium]|nr:dTDP-glucose 4,6-dehydratase [Candidatus Brocadiia bacterium]